MRLLKISKSRQTSSESCACTLDLQQVPNKALQLTVAVGARFARTSGARS
jgi:hypothetical protein